ncbi:MAG: large-conductance mechanosensitive channel protein MscL [Thermoanaerobaculia bacterium]|jgi:large conductance mechanosensitive channel|nr:MAG: large-conductance mechanosensitive channel protein MscL [Thermoanaerobaculia bacterium]MBZ0101952.1 large-conductance mechanosensitive channel protein MscL [Thermoanaerobaculia bacterium]
MGMISEFKTFVQRGNVMDMAVGVIIGGAFGKIVSSFVSDVLMPPIGLAIGGVKFSDLAIRLGGTDEAPVNLAYGAFLQATFDFLIIAFCVFLLVKAVNSMKKPAEPAPAPGPTVDQQLLTEIRDLLRQRG